MTENYAGKSPVPFKHASQRMARAVAEALEPRTLFAGIFLSNGMVSVIGTPGTDTIAAGIDPAATGYYYFLVQTAGQPLAEQAFPIASVTGVQVFASPFGTAPTNADADLVNLAGTNFGFATSVYGGNGADTIMGQLGPNVLVTGTGADNILYGGPASDTMQAQGINDTMRSGGGTDVMHAYGGYNIMAGGKDGSQMYGGSGYDTIRGGAGNATIFASTLGSLIIGGFGNDSITGGPSHDTIIAGTGHDTLIGGSGGDFLNSDWGSYLILQGGGSLPHSTVSDLVDGSAAVSDTLVASTGTPTLIGGSGVNYYDVNDLAATLSNARGSDFVAQNDTLSSASQIVKITLSIKVVQGGVTQNVLIPIGAGGAPSGGSRANAIDSAGTIAFLGFYDRTFNLDQFFSHWGVNFSATGIGQFVASPGSGHTLSMTVNGVANNQFSSYAIQNQDNIVITFTQ